MLKAFLIRDDECPGALLLLRVLNKILCPYSAVYEICIVSEMLAHVQAVLVTKK